MGGYKYSHRNESLHVLANKIKKQILLILGEEDNNSGTITMQSDCFFNPLKGHGALCRLVVLPFESHGYAARESIMHVLWETDQWLQKFCVTNNSDANASEVGFDKGATEPEKKEVVGTGDSSLELNNSKCSPKVVAMVCLADLTKIPSSLEDPVLNLVPLHNNFSKTDVPVE